MFACLGLGNLLADGYRATGWLLVGLLQIAVMLTLFGRWSAGGRSSPSPTAPRCAPTSSTR
jgi:hypothetical protein